MDGLNNSGETRTHAIVSYILMSISIFLMGKIESHLDLKQLLLLCWLLFSVTFLIKRKTNNNCLNNSAFLIYFLVFFSWFVRLQFDIPKKTIFWNNNVEIISLYSENLDRHYHIPFQCIRSLFQKIEKYLLIFHHSFRIPRIFKTTHYLTFHQLLVTKGIGIILELPVNWSNSLWVFEQLKEKNVAVAKLGKLFFCSLNKSIITISVIEVDL